MQFMIFFGKEKDLNNMPNNFTKTFKHGQQNQNKEFIIRYFNALSGVPKTRELLGSP